MLRSINGEQRKFTIGPLLLATISKLWRVNGGHKLYINNPIIFKKKVMQKYSFISNQAAFKRLFQNDEWFRFECKKVEVVAV